MFWAIKRALPATTGLLGSSACVTVTNLRWSQNCQWGISSKISRCAGDDDSSPAAKKIKVRPGLQQGLKKREADHQVSSLDPGGADAAVPVEAVAQMHCVSGCGLPVPTDRPERKKMARSD